MRGYSLLPVLAVLGAWACTNTPQVDHLPIQILVWMKYKAPAVVVVDAFVEVTNRGSVPLTDCWVAVGSYKKHFERLEPGVTLTIAADEFVWGRSGRKVGWLLPMCCC